MSRQLWIQKNGDSHQIALPPWIIASNFNPLTPDA
jgi:hypothetical protein